MIVKLVVLNFKSLFASMLLRSKRAKKASVPLLVGLTCLIALPFAVMFGGMFYGMRDVYFTSGLGWLYFAMQLVIVFSMCVLTTIFQAQAQVFNAKDNDLLLSMPLRPSHILTARVLTMLVTEYAFEVLVAGPAFVLWIIGGYANALGILFFAVGFLLVPLLALAVACLLAWIISTVTSRLRRKNVVTLVLAIAFFGAYFWVCGNLSTYMQSLFENGAQIGEAFEKSLFPAFHYGRAIADGNILSFLLFALCAIVPFVLIIALLSVNFTRIVTRNRGAKRIEYREKTLKTSGAVTALLKKELSHYAHKPMYVLNMSMGSVLSLGAMIMFLVRRDMILGVIGMYAEMIPWLTPSVVTIIALLFCASSSPASASLVSIEGRTLWLARSLPVRGRDALLAKLYMHLIVATSPIILAAIIAAFGTATDIISGLAAFLTPTLFALMIGMFGLIFNLTHPKFDWVNEIQPIKQGLPVMMTMFGSWGALVVVFVLGALLVSIVPMSIFLLVLDVLIAGVCVLMYFWLITAGERRWNTLDN